MSTLLTTYANRIARFFGYVRASEAETEKAETRLGFFAVNQALYDGTVYSPNAYGGFLENVLRAYVGNAFCDITKFPIFPHFMPFKEVVDCYQNVWPGVWGEQTKPADLYAGKPVNPKLLLALGEVARASNLNTEKTTLVRWAANFGTVGIRVTAQAAEGDKPARSVIGVDHPSRLFNFEEDSRGNVTAVVLKYNKTVNVGTLADPEWETVKVAEEITKDEFSRTHDGVEQLVNGERRNGLGFCPYVILRHKDNGTPYGDWAYKGSEAAVHRINWRISRQDKSIDRHQRPKWFGAAGGGKPETVPMGDESMTYVELKPDTPTPFLMPLVAQIDQEAAQAFWMTLRDELRGRQPELNLNDVKLLGNTSGEALAQILKPTEQAVLSVRPAYDHALIRSMQMAVSAGITVGAFDLGTGQTVEGADQAFRDGLENFEFAPRPAIPETPQQKITNATAAVAEKRAKLELAAAAKRAGVSEREAMRLAGYTDAEIEQMEEEIGEQDELPDEDETEDGE